MTSHPRQKKASETLIMHVHAEKKKKNIKFETLRQVVCYQEFFVELIAF